MNIYGGRGEYGNKHDNFPRTAVSTLGWGEGGDPRLKPFRGLQCTAPKYPCSIVTSMPAQKEAESQTRSYVSV